MYNIHTDFDRFEDACIQLKTEENPDMRHSLYHSAVDIYKGQLLPRCEHELWLMQLESNDSVRFCLKNGLELRESIERTVR